LVASGALPPVEERLPGQPMVVGPGILVHEDHLDWEVGTYDGGVLRAVTTNPTWSYPCQHALENILATPKHHITPLMPNLVEAFSVNDDVTEFSLTIRKGLKWSDGEPVTMDDIKFGWEDCNLNEQITPVVGSRYKDGGDPAGDVMTVTYVDDYTFEVKFKEPNEAFCSLWVWATRGRPTAGSSVPSTTCSSSTRPMLRPQSLNRCWTRKG
jgi:peptide/nickel transport system substrate-binding protein